ncbi:hypothetical protein PG994_015013 [Apiospora phragmitis]|uniref:M6 family metalloprotease domain-containing protein n=1 Tax=Apiospora phragmitis TaxID=2905665 RepID=A0ABR1SVA7_9PEZI
MVSQLTSVVAAIGLWHAMPSAAAIIPPSVLTADASIGACKLAGDAVLGFDLSEGVVPAGSSVVRGWMMFVDFPDAEAAGYTAQGVYDNSVAKANAWYQTSSYGRLSLNVSADVDHIYRMAKPSTAYDWANHGTSYNQMVFIEDALDAYMQVHGIAEAADLKASLPEMDVLYVVTPPSTPNFDVSYGSRYAAQTRSHNGTDGNVVEGAEVSKGYVTFGTGFFREETKSDGSGVNPAKIFVHETAHTLGLPDYYPMGFGLLEGEYVGGFSIMGSIGEQAPDMFAFDKWRMGWLDDSAVHCVTEKGTSTTHVLQPLEADGATGGVRAVMIPTSNTTALVAEARITKGVDASFCGVGVLLYTIDTKVRSGYGPVRVVNTLESELRWCGGYSLNEAPLSFIRYRSPSKTIKDLGITITLIEHDESINTWTIKVDYI